MLSKVDSLPIFKAKKSPMTDFEKAIHQLEGSKIEFSQVHDYTHLKHSAIVVLRNYGTKEMLTHFETMAKYNIYMSHEQMYDVTVKAVNAIIKDFNMKLDKERRTTIQPKSPQLSTTEIKETINAYCIECNRKNKHTILYTLHRKKEEIDYEITFLDDYQIIECNGCQSISFRHKSQNSEDNYDNEFYTEVIYPFRGDHLLQPKQYLKADLTIKQVYEETIKAYNNQQYVLCATGLRITIEAICKVEGIEKGTVTFIDAQTGKTNTKISKTLEGKINGLHEQGLLSKTQVAILHEHRFLGNDAAHEIVITRPNILKSAIEIVENVLDTLYLISEKGAVLTARRIPLKKKKKKNPTKN